MVDRAARWHNRGGTTGEPQQAKEAIPDAVFFSAVLFSAVL